HDQSRLLWNHDSPIHPGHCLCGGCCCAGPDAAVGPRHRADRGQGHRRCVQRFPVPALQSAGGTDADAGEAGICPERQDPPRATRHPSRHTTEHYVDADDHHHEEPEVGAGRRLHQLFNPRTLSRPAARPVGMIRGLRLLLRLLLGAVFVYAAYTKLRQSWLLFALSIDSYQLLPEWAVLALARTLPWFELAVGLLLVAGAWLRSASIAGMLLLALFFGVMVWSYARRAGIDCGCFGVGEALSAKTLARDGALLAAAITLAVMSRKS